MHTCPRPKPLGSDNHPLKQNDNISNTRQPEGSRERKRPSQAGADGAGGRGEKTRLKLVNELPLLTEELKLKSHDMRCRAAIGSPVIPTPCCYHI